MSTGNLTVTADIGPGEATVAEVFSDVRELRYDFPGDRLQLILANGKVRSFDYSTVATITHVIASGVATVTIST